MFISLGNILFEREERKRRELFLFTYISGTKVDLFYLASARSLDGLVVPDIQKHLIKTGGLPDCLVSEKHFFDSRKEKERQELKCASEGVPKLSRNEIRIGGLGAPGFLLK